MVVVLSAALTTVAAAQVPIHPQTDGTLPADPLSDTGPVSVLDAPLVGDSGNVSGALVIPGEFVDGVPPGLENFPFHPTLNPSATAPDRLPDGTLPPDIVGSTLPPPAGPQGALEDLDPSYRDMPITDAVTGQPLNGNATSITIPLPRELQLPPPMKTP